MVSQTASSFSAAAARAVGFAGLRPRDVPTLVDQAFRIYRGRFLTYLAVAAIVYIPVQVLVQAVTYFLVGTGSLLDGELFPTGNSFAISLLLTSIAGFVITAMRNALMAIPQAATTVAMLGDLNGEPTKGTGAYRALASRVRPLLGIVLVLFVISIGVFSPTILTAPALLAGSSSEASLLICFASVGSIVFFIFALRYIVLIAVAVPAMITEHLGTRDALRRSSTLVKGSWWRTAGLILLIYGLNVLIAAGPAALITSIVALFTQFDFVLTQLVANGVALITGLFFLPVQMVATTLYYFDLRVRKEGFDIEAALDMAYPATRPPEQGAYSPFVDGRPVTAAETPGHTTGPAPAAPMYPPVLGVAEQPRGTHPAPAPGTSPWARPGSAEQTRTPNEEGPA